MTERIVRPVRAWADYDGWMGFIDRADAPGGWKVYGIPQTGINGPYVTTADSIVDAVGFGLPQCPLRSLRVLYENGHELTARSREGTMLGSGDNHTRWDWTMTAPLTPGAVYALPGPVASGSFPEDSDSEAVERAMIAAAAWFSQRQD